MTQDKEEMMVAFEMLRSAAMARFRVLAIEGQENGEFSFQRARCHVHREDVPSAAVPLIFAIGALSFADARPRAISEVDYEETDQWTLADAMTRLKLEKDALVFDADYVRGRMMKTRIAIRPNGTVLIETRNRYLMIQRWLDQLKGKRQIRLVASES